MWNRGATGGLNPKALCSESIGYRSRGKSGEVACYVNAQAPESLLQSWGTSQVFQRYLAQSFFQRT